MKKRVLIWPAAAICIALILWAGINAHSKMTLDMSLSMGDGGGVGPTADGILLVSGDYLLKTDGDYILRAE